MSKKILLADDSITIQKVVELTFSDGDYEVIATSNGTRAIDKLRELRPDIILSDIIMPEKNGYEVCEYVKSQPELRHIPVILLTGTFEPFDPDRAEKAGCDAVVTKPFESQSLIQKVEELIQRSASAAPAEEAPAPPAADEGGPWAKSEDRSPFSEAQPASSEAESPFDEPPAPTGFPPPPEQDEVFSPSEVSSDAGETESAGRSAEPPTFEMAKPGEEFEAPPPPPEDYEEGGETKMIPRMTFADLERMEAEKRSAPPVEEPWEPEPEQPAEQASEEEASETRMIPQVTYEELRQEREAEPAESASPFEEQAEATAPFAQGFAPETTPQPPTFEPEPQDESPFDEERRKLSEPEPAEEPAFAGPDVEEPALQEPAFEEPAMEDETIVVQPPAEPAAFDESLPEPEADTEQAPPAAATPTVTGDALSDEQLDRLARRVTEMISDRIIREIAWEVIPEIAEMVVKERIRQLEDE